MVSDLTNAKHTVELGHLEELFAKMGYHSSLMEPSRIVPIPTLAITMPLDEKGRDRSINVLFVPVADGELETLELLQLHTQIPCQLDERRQPDVEKLIGALNNKIGMGCIGIDANNNIYYRYIYPKAKFESIDERLISETVLLFIYLYERFSHLVESVATGQQSLDTALNLVQEM
jgi:hypothetical protein